MPTITKLCFAIILSKLCLVEPSSTPHLAEDGWAKLWTQISSRSPEGKRGWRSGTLVSEQVPVHFTRLPLFPYRALWAQLHPWTFTCFSVRILQACLNWLSQPSILRRRTEKKVFSPCCSVSLQPCTNMHTCDPCWGTAPCLLEQHDSSHLKTFFRHQRCSTGTPMEISRASLFCLHVQLSPWAAFWLSRQGHSFFTTPGLGGENTLLLRTEHHLWNWWQEQHRNRKQ